MKNGKVATELLGNTVAVAMLPGSYLRSPTSADRPTVRLVNSFVRYKKLGYPTGQPTNPDDAYELWNNAHTATLEDYKLKEGFGILFHPSVEDFA